MSGVLVRTSAVKSCIVHQVPRVSGCLVAQQRDASDATPSKFKLGALKRGGGGRSSFSGIVATVFGANGFLAQGVINKLGKIGSQIILPYRCDPYWMRERRLAGDLGQVLFFPFDLKDEASIRKVLQHSNVCINLIGKDYETRHWSFQDAHMYGPQRIARIAKECGVEKFIHVSHLNAKEDMQVIFRESKYLKSKYFGDQLVREEFPEATIIKPTEMFGDTMENERFLRYYMIRNRWSHVGGWHVPLWKKGLQTIKQPVFVSDVATGIVQTVLSSGFEGKDIECVGAQRYYLNDIVDYVIKVLRRDNIMDIKDTAVPLQTMKQAYLRLYPANKWHKWMDLDKMEREYHTDFLNPSNPTLDDLGVELTPFDKMCFMYLHRHRRLNFYGESHGEIADPDPPKTVEWYEEKSQQRAAL